MLQLQQKSLGLVVGSSNQILQNDMGVGIERCTLKYFGFGSDSEFGYLSSDNMLTLLLINL